MRHHINKILFIVLVAAGTVACRKSENFPVDKQTSYYIFNPLDSAGEAAQGYLFGVYAVVKNGHNRVGGDYLDAAADDAVSARINQSAVAQISTNAVNSLSFPANENVWEESTPGNTPSSFYSGIRIANEFINGIPVVPVKGFVNNGVATATAPGVPMRYVWQSEARFLRAYFYYELVKRYGGVPLIGNKVYNIQDNVALPRSSFADCIKYIVSECDAVKDSLLRYPLATPDADNYRVTKGAALTLKAKALLLAASPLFNGGNVQAGNPLTGYTDVSAGAVADRWLQAANAAQAVINLGTYGLNADYRAIFTTQNNRELIMIRPTGMNTSIENNNGPVGFQVGGGGNTSPTQELVDAFPMQNGLAINAAGSGYNIADPYAITSTPKRDPRLASTILYNGSRWLNTNLETFEGGQSKPGGAIQQTVSGYYSRKFTGPSESGTVFVSHPADWVVFRYADVLLSFAEARNEVEGTPQADVYNQLYAIRQRAGIDPGLGGNYGLKLNMTKDEMRAAIQNEWRIEFAFEERRFFDIRRWKIAETVMNQPRRGVSIVKVGSALSYNYKDILKTTFTQKQYLHPIPYNEVAKNPNMKQNPGW
ncbi:RagB/SusD family nutrient uptake outer membrane protein [Mucilaginibacter myungsuensis]|uniref:RagB/SusD family nutrient uptake outer membrane protein n=1 Tax=Mucilaginibacter myungsuensis TaxID=649104 RepID=A0A929PYU5_9SPHI|nr:RagB/SusD family nutrient uptake outer membrane protein [Mucilaginibacter myungsuensis]MBE9663697.1 RagB/SusD family nutrient uptake outer membrane protein [Mucilaginibacter myungsuensis]MDN3598979.1 RagB/SusD family nutrient uptake outer membrane protein [Mucilaginibacter myungsuensis]